LNAEGNKVVICWSFSGTHTGTLLNIPATGKRATYTGISIYRIANGKVVGEKGEDYNLGFMQQLGCVLQPPVQTK